MQPEQTTPLRPRQNHVVYYRQSGGVPVPSVRQNPALYRVLDNTTTPAVYTLVASVDDMLGNGSGEQEQRFNHITMIDAPCETHIIDDADCGSTAVFVSGGTVTLHYAAHDDASDQKTLLIAAGTLVVIHLPSSSVRIALQYEMCHNEPIVVIMRRVTRLTTLEQARCDFDIQQGPQQPRLVRLFGAFVSKKHD